MSLIEAVKVPEGERGPWRVRRFRIPKEPTIGMLRLAMEGRMPQPGEYTQLVHAQRGIVMSDTTAERHDHAFFVGMAHGHCLINGLGIGMCLAAVLKKPQVQKVTVVEIDADLIDLVWPHYACERAEIVHASAFDYKPPKGVHYGAVWHDIWDSICADNLPEMAKLGRKYGKICDWQGCWARDVIRGEVRRRW